MLDFPQIVDSFQSLDISLSSQCVQQSLQPILPGCISYGVDSLNPSLRKISAIRLSLCEFENAGIRYPVTCNDLENSLAECMSELERSPQLWTTFSGYYREIQSICYESALPYEKDHIIALFNNITRVYGSFYENAKHSKEFSAQAFEELQRQFAGLETLVVDLFDQQVSQHHTASQEFSDYSDSVKEVLYETVQIFKKSTVDYQVSFGDMSLELIYAVNQIHRLSETVENVSIDQMMDGLQEQVTNWSQEAEMALSGILQRMGDLDFLHLEEASEHIRESLSNSQALAVQVNSQLSDNNDALKSQRSIITQELEHMLVDMELTLSNQVRNMLSASVSEVGKFAANAMHQLESTINNTQEKVQDLDQTVQRSVEKVEIATKFIDSTVTKFRNTTIYRFVKRPFQVSSIVEYIHRPFSSISSSILRVARLLLLGTLSVLSLLVLMNFSQPRHFTLSTLSKLYQIAMYIALVVSVILGACAVILGWQVLQVVRQL